MKKGRLQEIIKELQGASKMHLKQSKDLASHAEDMAKGSPAKKNGYNKVDVQDLQDMGEVKKDKKGKQYVVNERLTGTSKDTLSVGNHYSGRKYKPGELIDETDYEDMSEKSPLTDKDHASKNRSMKETREHARAHLRENQKNKREVLRERNHNKYTKKIRAKGQNL